MKNKEDYNYSEELDEPIHGSARQYVFFKDGPEKCFYKIDNKQLDECFTFGKMPLVITLRKSTFFVEFKKLQNSRADKNSTSLDHDL